MSLKDLINQMSKNYYIRQKKLWCGNLSVEIDHQINSEGIRSLDQPLDYKSAFKKMLVKLRNEKY